MSQLAAIRANAYNFTFTSQGYYFSSWYFAFKKWIRLLVG
jgi:hypothetical protein